MSTYVYTCGHMCEHACVYTLLCFGCEIFSLVPHFEHLSLSYSGTVAEYLGAGPFWEKGVHGVHLEV